MHDALRVRKTRFSVVLACPDTYAPLDQSRLWSVFTRGGFALSPEAGAKRAPLLQAVADDWNRDKLGVGDGSPDHIGVALSAEANAGDPFDSWKIVTPRGEVELVTGIGPYESPALIHPDTADRLAPELSAYFHRRYGTQASPPPAPPAPPTEAEIAERAARAEAARREAARQFVARLFDSSTGGHGVDIVDRFIVSMRVLLAS